MRISGLEVDGFGVWTGLKLEGLSDGLNVFYGPNEAGKTTLMQFVRSMLYGFSPARRRYLPPVHGGRSGGRVEVLGPSGHYQIGRHAGEQSDAHDELALLAADGSRQGEHLLKMLLSNVDEAIFNNVFAVGLEELQELSTLNDTDAAAQLYNLSAGLDRVSLIEVMRELQASRNRVLDASGGPCQILQLAAERDKLRAEIGELNALGSRYARLAAERDQVDREAGRLEEETTQLAHQCRVLEIALALRSSWQRRQELEEQLSAIGAVEAMPEGAIERLDAMNAGLKERQARIDELKKQRETLRAEAAKLKINEVLWRQAPRIEALAEQEDWIGTLEARIVELETEIAEAEQRLQTEQNRFGLEGDDFPMISPRSLAALQRPASAMRRANQRLDDAKREAAAGRDTARTLSEQIQSAITSRGERNLNEATERVGNLVAQLRRRVQIDERLEQLECHQEDLEEQSHGLLDRQMLPPSVLVGLGGIFVVGVILVLLKVWGVLSSTPILGAMGWPLTLLGIAAVGGAIFTKFMLERSNTRQMENCQHQLGLIQLQVKQAKEERDSLDKQLPRGGGPITARLEAAERNLAELEDIVPMDSRRHAAEQEADAATNRARQAEGELAESRRRWKDAVAAAGLPKGLSPKQVRELAACSEQTREIQDRLVRRREELEQRIKELDALTTRIQQLVKDTGLDLRNKTPIEQLHALAEQLGQQESRMKRRQAIRQEARLARHKLTKMETAIDRVKHERRRLLEEVGVKDEQELRQRAVRHARSATLRLERDSLEREVEGVIAGHCQEETIAQELSADSVASLEPRREQLQKRLEACQAHVKQRFEKRGQLNEQLKSLAENHTPAVKQLELAMVEKRLENAARRWQMLAVTHRVLDGVRKTYEETRQPETLQEASGYLARMTQNRHTRVWTPLSDSVLLVDDPSGRPMSVEALSRGVREQLFVCLRLALVSSYARRGVQLPLLLDDVLVNFDSRRAKAAAEVLLNFAESGHQLLVFTCHEHIARLFHGLKVEVTRLPDNRGSGATVSVLPKVLPKVLKNPPKRKRRREPEPYEVVAKDDAKEHEEIESPVVPTVEEPQLDVPEEDESEPEDYAPWDEEESDPSEYEPSEEEYDQGGVEAA